jgi:hypothetical protein
VCSVQQASEITLHRCREIRRVPLDASLQRRRIGGPRYLWVVDHARPRFQKGRIFIGKVAGLFPQSDRVCAPCRQGRRCHPLRGVLTLRLLGGAQMLQLAHERYGGVVGRRRRLDGGHRGLDALSPNTEVPNGSAKSVVPAPALQLLPSATSTLPPAA